MFSRAGRTLTQMGGRISTGMNLERSDQHVISRVEVGEEPNNKRIDLKVDRSQSGSGSKLTGNRKIRLGMQRSVGRVGRTAA